MTQPDINRLCSAIRGEKARIMFDAIGELWLAENDAADATGYAYIADALRSAAEALAQDWVDSPEDEAAAAAFGIVRAIAARRVTP